jgi:hypothetical protein
MSDFRVEKCRAEAELTLSTGGRVNGAFFLAGFSGRHSGPERVSDLLNGELQFFPFEVAGTAERRTVLFINRAHVTTVALPPDATELQIEPPYGLAVRRRVSVLLSDGARVAATVSICLPPGHDRLSDYVQFEHPFQYFETPERTLIINSAYIVELMEIVE